MRSITVNCRISDATINRMIERTKLRLDAPPIYHEDWMGIMTGMYNYDDLLSANGYPDASVLIPTRTNAHDFDTLSFSTRCVVEKELKDTDCIVNQCGYTAYTTVPEDAKTIIDVLEQIKASGKITIYIKE